MLYCFSKNRLMLYTTAISALLLFLSPVHAGKYGEGEKYEEDSRTVLAKHKPSHLLNAERLSTPQDHINFLIEALCTANQSVMISSYSIYPQKLFESGVEDAIKNASARGVKIYIYYQKLPWLPKDEFMRLNQLSQFCERFEETENHAKCLIRDKTSVAIGSHDWLSDRGEDSINASWIVSGDLAERLSEDIWQGIRFYQSLKYDNLKGVKNFINDDDAFSTAATEYAFGQFLYTLRTPEAHVQFLEDEVFGKAQKEILICSPFIRLARLKQIFSAKLLQNLENKQVRTHLATRTSPNDRQESEEKPIFAYLKELKSRYPHFSFSTHPTLHSKTIMVDDDLLCEGSFNVLSAVDDILHGANNFEMSVALRGDNARSYITDFRQTQFGQEIALKAVVPTFSKRVSSNNSLCPKGAKKKFEKEAPQTVQIPQSFSKHIQIFSGASFNKNGFCVRLNGNYLIDEKGKTAYFLSPKQAEEVAYQVWTDERSTKETPQPSQIPQSFSKHIQIFSGALFNKKGFCVRLDGEYLVDEKGKTAYFPSPEQAGEVAYQVWMNN